MNSDVEVATNHTSSDRNKQKRRDHNSKTLYLIRTYFMKQCLSNKVSRYNRKSPRERSRSPYGVLLPICRFKCRAEWCLPLCRGGVFVCVFVFCVCFLASTFSHTTTTVRCAFVGVCVDFSVFVFV
jgi:hypothetical protein